MSGEDDGRRLFARVEETVGVRVRPLTLHEAARLARHRLLGTPDENVELPPPPPGDESWERAALVAILARLEKLERLVAAALQPAGEQEEEAEAGDAGWITGESRTLSGGGLGVLLPRPLASGTAVEVELLLPGDSPVAIRAIGRVASCSEPTPFARALVGIAFTGIHAADREALVRFTFRVQRARLRERRRGDDPGPVL